MIDELVALDNSTRALVDEGRLDTAASNLFDGLKALYPLEIFAEYTPLPSNEYHGETQKSAINRALGHVGRVVHFHRNYPGRTYPEAFRGDNTTIDFVPLIYAFQALTVKPSVCVGQVHFPGLAAAANDSYDDMMERQRSARLGYY